MSDNTSLAIASLQIPKKSDPDGYRQHASQAEAALLRLRNSGISSDSLDDAVLIKLSAYTDSKDPWTTPASASVATSLLPKLPKERAFDFIVNAVLQRYLRPIFAQSTTKVTSSGRASQYPGQDAAAGAGDAGFDEPKWKKENGLSVVTTFAWAVEASNCELFEKNWPLFTPPLITLLEDRDTSVRERALHILITFLGKCPGGCLRPNGIGTVLQDAVYPTLLYLPSLTPEAESVTLIRPAYAALLTLAKTDPDVRNAERRKRLDKMLRDGVFAAYHHSSEHIRIVEVLTDATAEIVTALSIFAAKHLQAVLGMLSSVMTDPFATAHGPAILSACKALNSCVRECWPRMAETEHMGEVMRMISVCWLNVHSDSAGPKVPQVLVGDIEFELKLTSKMLRAIRSDAGLEAPPEVEEICQQEPRLSALFLAETKPSS